MALLQQLNRTGITVVLVTHEHDIAAFASGSSPSAMASWSRTRRTCRRTRPPRWPGPTGWRRSVPAPVDADGLPRHPSRRARGAARQQAALGVDDARHHHRRRRGDRDGRRGAGAQARVEDQIKSLGSNLIIVLSARSRRRRAHGVGHTADDHRGGRLRLAARNPERRGVGAAVARLRADRVRQLELGELDHRRHARVPGRARLADVRRPAAGAERRRRGSEGRAARQTVARNCSATPTPSARRCACAASRTR